MDKKAYIKNFMIDENTVDVRGVTIDIKDYDNIDDLIKFMKLIVKTDMFRKLYDRLHELYFENDDIEKRKLINDMLKKILHNSNMTYTFLHHCGLNDCVYSAIVFDEFLGSF